MPGLHANFLGFLKRLDAPAELLGQVGYAQDAVQACLAEELEAFSLAALDGHAQIKPRFFLQGSWAYGTLNHPGQIPPQQMDVDLGVYLPVSYMEDQRPSIAAKDYFAKVESLLAPLAISNGWRLDDSKETCARLVLSELLHLDLPLYCIPDQEFNTLPRGSADPPEGGVIVGGQADEWSQLPTEHVIMALRPGDWRVSDPRLIERWFLEQLSLHGEQFRSCCRYLKAWRDHLWRSGGPSSIFLMILCSNAFRASAKRDDLAMLALLRRIPEALTKLVTLPNGSGDELLVMQDDEELELLKSEAARFHLDLAAAIKGSDANESCQCIAKHLGPRFRMLGTKGA